MRQGTSALLVLGCSAVLLAGLVRLSPFGALCTVMDKAFGAPPKWTQVTNFYRDSRTQEVTDGDDVVASLTLLKSYWRQHPLGKRIVFVGNSQMHAISLAPGEPPAEVPEKTYFDLINDEVVRTDPNELLYRLSSSGMSYPEVLWELTYMLDDPDLRADTVVLQMNYQAFWTGKIRNSLLPMLCRPAFRARVETLAASGRFDSFVYADALHRFDQVEPQRGARFRRVAHSGLPSAFVEQVPPGYALEGYVRTWTEKLVSRRQRAILKESFLEALYSARLYLLHLKPSTARSISGSRLLAARSAVESIAKLCVTNNIHLLLFHAPVNPRVSLYSTPEDRSSYRSFVANISHEYHLPLFDLENSIPADEWGSLLNGPDPLHLGRSAHQQMARQILSAMDLVAPKN